MAVERMIAGPVAHAELTRMCDGIRRVVRVIEVAKIHSFEEVLRAFRTDGWALATIVNATASQALSTAERRRRERAGVERGELEGCSGTRVELIDKNPWVRSMPARVVSVRSRRDLASDAADQVQPLGGLDAPEIRGDVGWGRLHQGVVRPSLSRRRPSAGRPLGRINLSNPRQVSFAY